MFDEAAILEAVKAKGDLTNDELMQFLSAGEKSIALVEHDIRKRITFLLWLACLNDPLQKEIEKNIPHAKSQAIDMLCSTANAFNNVLVQLAKIGMNANAAEFIWDNGVKMVSAINELASTQPNLLRPKARKAIYMPSFRAKAKRFTDNFHVVSEAVELSKDFPTKTGDSALYDLDSLVTQFVVELLDEAQKKRELLINVASFFDSPLTLVKLDCLKDCSREQALLSLPGIRPEHLAYLDLQPYSKATAKAWWEKCIKPELDFPDTLKRLEGTKLHKLLSAGAKLRVDYAIRDYFKKLCESKVLESLAP